VQTGGKYLGGNQDTNNVYFESRLSQLSGNILLFLKVAEFFFKLEIVEFAQPQGIGVHVQQQAGQFLYPAGND